MRASKETQTVNPAGSPNLTDTTPRRDYRKTPFENFEGLAAKLLKVPKQELDEKRTEQDKARKHKQD
jgi:hypothetical protein